MAKQWNLRQLVFAWNGLNLAQGYGFDGGVTIEPDDVEFWTKKVGGDAESTRHATNKPGGKVTLKVTNTANVNNDLTEAQQADALLGTGVGALLIRDPNGNLLVRSPVSWIQGRPKMDLNTETGEREWVFDCEELLANQGGSFNI